LSEEPRGQNASRPLRGSSLNAMDEGDGAADGADAVAMPGR